MSVKVLVEIQRRSFEHAGYFVLVMDRYFMSDSKGYPSWFTVVYTKKENKMAMLALSLKVDFNQLDNASIQLLESYEVKTFTIKNEGFLSYNKHQIDWAVEEAKKRIN